MQQGAKRPPHSHAGRDQTTPTWNLAESSKQAPPAALGPVSGEVLFLASPSDPRSVMGRAVVMACLVASASTFRVNLPHSRASVTSARTTAAVMEAPELDALRAQIEELQRQQMILELKQQKARLLQSIEDAQLQTQVAPKTTPPAQIETVVPQVAAPPVQSVAPPIQEIAPPVKVAPPIQEIAPPIELAPKVAPISESLSVPTAPMPSMSDLSGIFADTPAAAKAVVEAAPAAAASAGTDGLMVLGGALAFVPLAVVGVNVLVRAITGPEAQESEAALNELQQKTADEARTVFGAADGSVGGNTGRSASDIFSKGLENLASEPFGWLYGSQPSALYSNLPAQPTVAAPRQMGMKERARKSGSRAVPTPMTPSVPSPMAMPMDGIVAPSVVPPPPVPAPASVAESIPKPVAPPPEPTTFTPKPMAAVAAVAAPVVAPVAAPPQPVAAMPQPVAAVPQPVAPPPKPVEVAPAASKAIDSDVVERMAQLDELLEMGLVSQQEYDTKRAAILDGI